MNPIQERNRNGAFWNPRSLRAILFDQYAACAQPRYGKRRGHTEKSTPAFDRASSFSSPVIMLSVITTRYLALRKAMWRGPDQILFRQTGGFEWNFFRNAAFDSSALHGPQSTRCENLMHDQEIDCRLGVDLQVACHISSRGLR
jgi:hypothetical protein